MLTIIGIGPTGLHLMAPAVQEAVATMDVLVGGKRHLQQSPDFTDEQFAPGANILELLSWVSTHQEKRAMMLASGDPLFYGIGTRMVAHFGIENVWIIPGISAVQYLCAQSNIDMNGIQLTSSHGHNVRFDELARHNKMAIVTDALYGPHEITQQLIARDKEHRWMVVGKNLTIENEQIHFLPVREVSADYNMDAVVILDER